MKIKKRNDKEKPAKKITTPLDSDVEEFDLELDEKDVSQLTQQWLAGNDPSAAVDRLLKEKYAMRKKLRTLKSEVEALREFEPEEGGAVFSADEVKELEAYRELGKADEVKIKLATAETLKAKSDELAAKVTIGEAAATLGFNKEVLERLATQDGIKITLKEIEVDGKHQKKPYTVKTEDGKETETPLDEYAKSKWSLFDSALRQSNKETLRETGTKFSRQPSSQQSGDQKYKPSSAIQGSFSRFAKKE